MSEAAKIVEEFLPLLMIPDPEAARPGRARRLQPYGTPFEGNRYVDRYVVRLGKIVSMKVWNDSAERLLVRAGLAKP